MLRVTTKGRILPQSGVLMLVEGSPQHRKFCYEKSNFFIFNEVKEVL
jgi:hypothetical protein